MPAGRSKRAVLDQDDPSLANVDLDSPATTFTPAAARSAEKFRKTSLGKIGRKWIFCVVAALAADDNFEVDKNKIIILFLNYNSK